MILLLLTTWTNAWGLLLGIGCARLLAGEPLKIFPNGHHDVAALTDMPRNPEHLQSMLCTVARVEKWLWSGILAATTMEYTVQKAQSLNNSENC